VNDGAIVLVAGCVRSVVDFGSVAGIERYEQRVQEVELPFRQGPSADDRQRAGLKSLQFAVVLGDQLFGVLDELTACSDASVDCSLASRCGGRSLIGVGDFRFCEFVTFGASDPVYD